VTVELRIQPEAEADLTEAFKWYEDRKLGLGHELLAEVDRSFERIVEAPSRPRPLYRGTRRAFVRRFPYIVLYVPTAEIVFVLAVMHERRNPRAFQARVLGFEIPEN
jgi:plasmid stabilization system protein ParE